MAAFEATPIAVAIIGTFGMVTAAYIAYKGGQKYTKKKVDDLPKTLVSEFAKLNPGVDTVEKVIELLYAEIGRLNKDKGELEDKVKHLIEEKQELLDEINNLKKSLGDHQRKLEYLEARIKKTIPEDGV